MIVRKSSAILAVSALVLLSVVTGSTAAFAAVPAPPTVAQLYSPNPWITTDGQPSLQGSSDLGVTQIEVFVSTTADPTLIPYCTVPVDPSSSVWFGCTPTTASLTVGENYLSAIATNADGPSLRGAPIPITRVIAPTITSPADGLYTNDPMPTFSGTSEGTYFKVLTMDETDLCDGTVVNSSWNCEAMSPGLEDGDYEYLVATTFGTTEITSASRMIHIDTVSPDAPTIDPPASPADSTPGPIVSGIAEENATIDLLVDGTSVACNTGPIDYTGSWSCSLPSGLAAGPHSLTALQTDLAGNLSALSAAVPLVINDTTPPAPPVVTSPIGTIIADMNRVITNDRNPTVTGTGEPGGELMVLGNLCLVTPTIIDTGGNWSCDLTTPMADGVRDVHFSVRDGAGNVSLGASPYLSFLVDTIAPGTPTVATPTGPISGGVIRATTTSTHPVITGAGENGATVSIYRDGSLPLTCLESPLIVVGGGFSCTVSDALASGVYTFAFTQSDEAGNPSGTPVTLLELTVLAPPAPPAPPVAPPAPPVVPVVTTAPLLFAWILNFEASSSEVLPGQNISFTANSLPPGAVVTAELHSDPIFLGTTIVKPDGTFLLNTVIPNTAELGNHHYVVTVTPNDGSPAATMQQPVTILTMPVAETPTTTTTTTTETAGSGQPTSSGGSGPGAAISRDEPAAPNTLSQTLPTMQQILENPLVVGAAAASSLALLFLVAFPAELLNSTIDENYERMFGRIPKPKLPWLTRLREKLKKKPLLGGFGLTALAALIFSFSDPHFGFDLASLRLFLACLIGMFVLGYLANIVTSVILKRRWSIGSVIELQPLGLTVAILGVVLSRVLDFAPGLLIGLVLGLSLSASATLKDEARSVLVWAGVVLGIAVGCWVVYSLMSGVVAPDTFGGALFDDTLVAVTTEGISGLVIGLLPIGYLDGASVFRHSKAQWVGTYILALIAFFVIVVPSGALWGDIQGPFWTWLIVLLVFAAVCVGTYLYFKFYAGAEKDADDAEKGSDGPSDKRMLETAGE